MYKYVQIQKIRIVGNETHIAKIVKKLENKKDQFWRKHWKNCSDIEL